MTRVSIHQPGYHRDIYYYAKLLSSDIMVSFDTAQFVRRDWQNRQRFIVNGALHWLTVPVASSRGRLVDTQIASQDFLIRHWKTIRHVYGRHPYWPEFEVRLGGIYSSHWSRLVDLCAAIDSVAREYLDIRTSVVPASTLDVGRAESVGERLVKLCEVAYAVAPSGPLRYVAAANVLRADHYLRQHRGGSRPLDEFSRSGIPVVTFGLREDSYPQALGVDHFIPNLSIFDLFMNLGPGSGRWLRDRLAPSNEVLG